MADSQLRSSGFRDERRPTQLSTGAEDEGRCGTFPTAGAEHREFAQSSAVSRALVLSESKAVSEAIVRSLDLRYARSAVFDDLHAPKADGSYDSDGPGLAIVIQSDENVAVAAVGSLKHRWPRARVLVIGGREEESQVLRCVAAGADGFVTRDESLADVVQAVRDVSLNCFRPPPRLVRPLLSRLLSLVPNGPPRGDRWVVQLSRREAEVLGHLRRGESNKEIAVSMHVEVQTVKNHARRLFRKLGVRNRFDAVRVAPPVSG